MTAKKIKLSSQKMSFSSISRTKLQDEVIKYNKNVWMCLPNA